MFIRNLIIPGIVALAVHAAVLFTPPEKPPPPPPGEKIVVEELILGELPQVPIIPDEDRNKEDPIELPEIKVPPMAFENITTNAESLFTVPFNPVIPPPNTGDVTMVTPGAGDYMKARGGPGNDVKGLFTLADLENKPRTLYQAAPDYPHALKVQGVTGDVVVTFTVDEGGNVQDVRVVRSTNVEFEMPTIRAVSKWRFEPGRKDGRKVKFRMSVPVAFSLNEDN